MEQAERLMDLFGLLVRSKQSVTFEEIRDRVPDAYTQEDVDSAKRMFERDKDALRELGVPIETRSKDIWTEESNAYFVDPDRYYLPEISFSKEEAAALFVAAGASGEVDAEKGLRKLLASVGTEPLDGSISTVSVDSPELSGGLATRLSQAIADGRAVSFSYRAAQGETSQRTIDPYAIVWRSGHYYLVGMDRDRSEIRCFRVSRFASDPGDAGEAQTRAPEDFRGRDHVVGGPWGPDEAERVPVTIAFSERVSWWATQGIEGVESREVADGWEEKILPGSTDDSFVSWVLSFGPDARVLDPTSLRSAVLARLEEALANSE